MKKNLLFLLATAAVATGCSKDSVLESDVNTLSNAISFDTYKSITKGTPIQDHNGLKIHSLNVAAFVPESAVAHMEPTTIIWNEETKKWVYKNIEETAYWPTGTNTNLNFHAYAPLSAAVVTPTFAYNGLGFGYTVSEDVVNQLDLMFASEATSKVQTVPLNFKHALTQVHFAVSTAKSNLKIDVESITINNIKKTGTFSSVEIGDGNGWTVTAGSETSYLVPVAKEFTAICKDIKVEKEGELVAIGYQKISLDENALMLLPQTFDASVNPANAEDKGAYLSVACKIYSVDAIGNAVQYYTGTASSFETLNIPFASRKVENGVSTEIWNRSKKITYNLSFGNDFSDIQFDAIVLPWEDGDNIVVTD